MTAGGRGATLAFASVTTLFFAWGFISSNNDPLIVSLRAIFALSYTEALVTQLMFFLGYGVMSLPAASISNRIGPTRTILVALATMIAGCLLIVPSAATDAYPPILAALFVLAIGITTLQVASNPLAAALGPAEGSHFRLTLAQAFNSLGVVIGAHYGSRIMLGEGVLAQTQGAITAPAARAEALGTVTQAFLLIAAMLGLLWLFIWTQRRRINAAIAGMAAIPRASAFDALRSRWALFGALSLGLYVGAEVSIGSIMINFLHQPDVLALPFAEGGAYLANFYWGGALVGRFAGSWLLTRIAAARLLTFAALTAALLCAIVTTASGSLAGYAALAVGLFNSIMFPTIFTLTLERSGVSQASTSGLLCLAIVGGAVVPMLVGLVADTLGLGSAFAVPLIAYGVIGAFAWRANCTAPRPIAHEA